MGNFLGVDCGSVSLNLVLLSGGQRTAASVYVRTRGRPLDALAGALEEMMLQVGENAEVDSARVTGSGRFLISNLLKIQAVNEITAHAAGAWNLEPRTRTIIEIGGQDSKFIRIEPPTRGLVPRIPVFRMNEICAAGTGAFLDEQSDRLGIDVSSFGPLALESSRPAPIAARCAVFAKSDMIHRAQEGTPLHDILLGLAFGLVRNYMATLVRGENLKPVISLQGGVMKNQAVTYAFRKFLGLEPDKIVVPRMFDVLGAYGCAVLAGSDRSGQSRSLARLKVLALEGTANRNSSSFQAPLCSYGLDNRRPSSIRKPKTNTLRPPFVLGLDIGSVSVKGVIIDRSDRIVAESYMLSRSKPLESLGKLFQELRLSDFPISAVAVTGSGRYLVGRLLEADLIIDEITAHAASASTCSKPIDTVVEIGGQDSKWLSLEEGMVTDFEMNRVCAAGTGSFLMAQADRLGLSLEKEFSSAALSSQTPVDLGCRCTVFMESDLIHHQNNGACAQDLAAGVSVSIAKNYLERVANRKPFGDGIIFLGGVAANPAVHAAFEQLTGKTFEVPEFYRVAGALGAAIKCKQNNRKCNLDDGLSKKISLDPSKIVSSQFSCGGCSNSCSINRYKVSGRTIFSGGVCDRWETDSITSQKNDFDDEFTFRSRLLEHSAIASDIERSQKWGMIRVPHYYEFFPFWRSFLDNLGISLILPSPPDRKQFEEGLKFLKVETCLPMKILPGQVCRLIDQGVQEIFYPSILSEPPAAPNGKPRDYCPYIQASSYFFRGMFELKWRDLVVSFRLDPNSFQREHIRFARDLGFSRDQAFSAFYKGLEEMKTFQDQIRSEGRRFLDSLEPNQKAIVVLGKPYHTSEKFLNMNLGTMFRRLGIPALPSDLYPLSNYKPDLGINWKHQDQMAQVAREISKDPRLFPVFISFFGCGPDPFTQRHLQDALEGKPLLILEMDEHSSRVGVMTRIEAFLQRIETSPPKMEARPSDSLKVSPVRSAAWCEYADQDSASPNFNKSPKKKLLYLPYLGEISYGFAAAARYFDIDAAVLPEPDDESEQLAKPHLVGGECYPYALLLGDYIKLAQNIYLSDSQRSSFYILGPDACRLSQFSVYIEKVRRDLGLSVEVSGDFHRVLEDFNITGSRQQLVLLKGWEGLNAFDMLMRIYYQVRPLALDKENIDSTYNDCRKKLMEALSNGRGSQGLEEVLHDLYQTPIMKNVSKPRVCVTGDYYTRVVSYANNGVYEEIENLGGMMWTPPTFSDCFKMSYLRDFIWSLLSRQSRETAARGLFYLLLVASEFKLKSLVGIKRRFNTFPDLWGRDMWRIASNYTNLSLPAGITGPVATAMQDIGKGADGMVNLMTLNCSFGTVVTAALSDAIKDKPDIPMLTLVYDGLKKTNERTRLEAFMEQVWNNFRFRSDLN